MEEPKGSNGITMLVNEIEALVRRVVREELAKLPDVHVEIEEALKAERAKRGWQPVRLGPHEHK